MWVVVLGLSMLLTHTRRTAQHTMTDIHQASKRIGNKVVVEKEINCLRHCNCLIIIIASIKKIDIHTFFVRDIWKRRTSFISYIPSYYYGF